MSDEAKSGAREKFDAAVELNARAAAAAFYNLPGADVDWGTMPPAEKERWLRVGERNIEFITHRQLADIQRDLDLLVARSPDRVEAPAPEGWLLGSRTHWDNGETASFYRSPEDLRDFFAASALNGELCWQGLEGRGDLKAIAGMAYRAADEMMAARKGGAR